MSVVNDRLESAATTLIVEEVFATSVKFLEREEVLLVSLFVLVLVYMVRQVSVSAARGERAGRERLYVGVLDRTMLVLLGLVTRVLMSFVNFTTVQSVTVPTSAIAYKLAVMVSLLIFTSVLLHDSGILSRLVSVVLYMFSDGISRLLESGDAGMPVPFVAFVVLICTARVRLWVEGRVAGLGVVLDAVYMANVNWVLDLVRDNSSVPMSHVGLLLLILCVLEVCIVVEPSLRETQSYALYKVSSLVFVYLMSWDVDLVCVVCVAVMALVLTSMHASQAIGYQLAVLVLMNLVLYEFNAMLLMTYGAVRLLSLSCLVVFFETVKMVSENEACARKVAK
jgi:hypothetical protein